MAKIEWIEAPEWLDAEITDAFGLYQITDDGILFIGHDSTGKCHESMDAPKTTAQVDWDNRLTALSRSSKEALINGISVRLTGPDADGEFWLHLADPAGRSAGLNLGNPSGMIASALLRAVATKPTQVPA